MLLGLVTAVVQLAAARGRRVRSRENAGDSLGDPRRDAGEKTVEVVA